MIGTKPTRLSFSPALPCVDCKCDTSQGLLYQMSALVWQLLPPCDTYIEEPPGSAEPVSLSALRYRINEQLTIIHHLRRRKRHMAHAYARLRRHHVPLKTLRAPLEAEPDREAAGRGDGGVAMTVKRGDWVTAGGSAVVGRVKRLAHDGSWADVDWYSHAKRMQTPALTIQHTIPFAPLGLGWTVTDETRRAELEEEVLA